MKQEKNVVVKKGCHSQKSLLGISLIRLRKQAQNFCLKTIQQTEDPRVLRTAKSGMTPNLMGFTLIELLVVVLIIGILAAVAVPQYKKAVYKSRLTQWITYVSSLDKALDAWILANGYPTSTIYLSGENASLDIDMTCTSVSGKYCYTDIGRFNFGCQSNGCWIDFGTDYEGYKGPFPTGNNKGRIWTSKFSDGSFNNQRVLSHTPSDENFRKIVCEWWGAHYGKELMYERAITGCAEVGI